MFYDCVIKTHAPVNYIYTRLSEHHDFFFKSKVTSIFLICQPINNEMP